MAEEKVEFELVTPEKLLLSEHVDMVVVPGEEGDFGVLRMHAPMISVVRPGIIRTFDANQVKAQIFVAGGFAEVTPARCTMLAEQAVPVDEIDTAAVEDTLRDAREDLADAKDDASRNAAEQRIAVGEAMMKAAQGTL